MEEFKNINITKHAIVRYFNRVRGVMVTDINYDGWKILIKMILKR